MLITLSFFPIAALWRVLPDPGGGSVHIDYLSLHIRRDSAPDLDWIKIGTLSPILISLKPGGEEEWRCARWTSSRSDSSGLSIKASESSLSLSGSPARVMGDGDAVFGPFNGLSITDCALAMISFFSRSTSIDVPPTVPYRISRIDVTQNYLLSDIGSVRVALSQLRSVEGGRYRVSQQAGDTVYYSHTSKRLKGKAYAKGPHVRFLARKGDIAISDEKIPGVLTYSPVQALAMDRLLRLELTIGSKLLHERPDLSSDGLRSAHASYFERMMTSLEGAMQPQDIYHRLCDISTKRQAAAALSSYSVCRQYGWQTLREMLPRNTFYRHLKLLRAVGITDGDMTAGNFITRGNPIVLTPVNDFDQLAYLTQTQAGVNHE